MFSKTIVNSARFLRMPPSSRLLYYDLGMAADDDGAVEGYCVMKATGATEDDLKLLAAKGFIRILNDDCVCWITDWATNNQLRRDRYTKSTYQDLLCAIPEWKPALKAPEPFEN